MLNNAFFAYCRISKWFISMEEFEENYLHFNLYIYSFKVSIIQTVVGSITGLNVSS